MSFVTVLNWRDRGELSKDHDRQVFSGCSTRTTWGVWDSMKAESQKQGVSLVPKFPNPRPQSDLKGISLHWSKRQGKEFEQWVEICSPVQGLFFSRCRVSTLKSQWVNCPGCGEIVQLLTSGVEGLGHLCFQDIGFPHQPGSHSSSYRKWNRKA